MNTPKPWEPPTPAEIKKRWNSIVDDMLDIRRNFQLNHSYYMGEQWINWDDTTAAVGILDLTSAEDAASRVTVNKVKPRVLSLLARLTRTPLAFEPRPHGVDSEAVRKADLERQVLDVESHRAEWGTVRSDEVLNCLLGAVAAVSVEPDWEWDPQPITLIATSEQVSLPKRPAVTLTALSAVEFGIEPGSRSERDARWWIRNTTLTPEQAQDRYGLDKPPSPDSLGSTASAMHRTLLSRRKSRATAAMSTCMVYVYYERPSNRSPGCVIHVIGDKIVQQSEWPFSFTDRLNVHVFIQTPVGGTWKGETVMNDARQLQRNYNMAFTSINRHIGKADNARMILPIGATIGEEDDLTGDVGEVIRVDPSVGNEPHWMNAPQIPRWLREHIELLQSEMDELFSTHAVTRGQAPGDRNSGLALSILAEKDETPLGPMATNQQTGWQRIAEMVLSTMKHLMTQVDQVRNEQGMGPMQVTDVRMSDQRTPEEVTWSAADLPDNPVVHVPLESVMPRSQAAQMETMIRLSQSFPMMFQDLTPGELATIMRTPDAHVFATVKDPQQSLALWENGRMVTGVGDDEVIVWDWHDHPAHIAKHNDLRATEAYRNAAPEVQAFIDAHIDAHATLEAEAIMKAQEAQMAQMRPAPAPDGQLSIPGLDGPPEDEPMEVAV